MRKSGIFRVIRNLFRAPPVVSGAVRLLAAYLLCSSLPAFGDYWLNVASMQTPRSGHSATLLSNGEVLVVGGSASASAELYDPVSNTWRMASPPLEARKSHTATRLPDGKVLIVGGVGNNDATIQRAELYIPTTDTWLDAGAIDTPRRGHTATLLPNGKVLIVGGDTLSGHGAKGSAELYDVSSGLWSKASQPFSPRWGHDAVLLADGRVLVVGGSVPASNTYSVYADKSEIYSPDNDAWNLASAPDKYREALNKAFLMRNGQVFLVGRVIVCISRFCDVSYNPSFYNVTSDTWSNGKISESFASRENFTATLQTDGRVMLAGGTGYNGYYTTASDRAVIYDPVLNVWSSVLHMRIDRSNHTATPLDNGKVLVAGGLSYPSPHYHATQQASAELFDPSIFPPGAPGNVVATPGNGRVTITFTAPASTGGLPITSYTVTTLPYGGVDQQAGSAELTHVITGLTNGRTYSFTVTANNAAGAGSASAVSNSVTPVFRKTGAPAATFLLMDD